MSPSKRNGQASRRRTAAATAVPAISARAYTSREAAEVSEVRVGPTAGMSVSNCSVPAAMSAFAWAM